MDNFEKLAALFPNAITETTNDKGEVVRAVDADILRQEIGAEVIEGRTLRYEFNWPDKDKALSLANTLTDKALRLDRDKSTGRDGTPRNIDSENVYIEGDNLDALQILRQTYMCRVKMIYIDPPYNTGNDFIYNDNFTISTDDYEERYGEYVHNPASNGRFHTDWLNMIYPRLKVARDFLSPDGVIFISIDDNEQANLRKMCDEIFGSGNFVATFTWKRRSGANDAINNVSIDHEYILCYSRYLDAKLKGVSKAFENYSNPDNDPRGEWAKDNLTCGKTASQRPNLYYPITDPKTGITYECNPNRVWSFEKSKMEELIRADKVIFPPDGNGRPAYKRHKSEVRSGTKPYSTIIDTELNSAATKELREILGGQFFDYSKPLDLLKQIIFQATKPDSIILDFFSGSATTAHAVMALNAADGGRRKFILVQLPEVTGEKSEARKAGYETICDIGEERIRRAGRKLREESPLTTKDLDVGFRVFRVDSSNIKEEIYKRPDEYIQGQLEIFDENIKHDRTPEDLLIQVMLQLGMELSAKIEEDFVAGKHVFIVNDGYLIACFDERINKQTITYMGKRQPAYVAFRDSCFESDAMMINAEQLIKAYSPKTRWEII